MRGHERRLRRLEGAGRRQVQDMSDEELDWELAEIVAPEFGISVETAAAQIPSGIYAENLARLLMEMEVARL